MTELVKVEHHPHGLVEVCLHRPDKMNAITPAMFNALIAAGEALIHQPGLRCVVLRGEGKAFCAGLDLSNFEDLRAGTSKLNTDKLTERTHGDSNRFQRVATVWRDIPVPVIAACHGVVFGGGLQIALGADMRFITADAKVSIMEIKWGLVPDMAGMIFLRELMRSDVARDLIFSGRVLSGTEAVQLGLATRTCADPLADAMQYASEIIQKSPQAIRAAKRLLNSWSIKDDAGLLLAEAEEQSHLIGSAEQLEAVMANLEKRFPHFVDPT
jgi:enoyl-CoA hydratase/carnithine racemase